MQGQNRNPARLAAAVPVLVSLWLASSLFLDTDKMASVHHNEWGEVHFHQATARESFLTNGRPPLWCPYVNGGYPLAGHPYGPSFFPLFPVTLALGERTGASASKRP